MVNLQPRYERIHTELQVTEIQPLVFEEFHRSLLPQEMGFLTEEGSEYQVIENGRCSLVLLFTIFGRKYILKIASGEYRKQELNFEYQLLKIVANEQVRCAATSRSVIPGSIIPMPFPFGYSEYGNLAFLLQEYRPGKAMNIAWKDLNDPMERLHMIRELGVVLSQIHALESSEFSWDSCLTGQLVIAQTNLENQVLDLDEFEGLDTPERILRWLRENRPIPGKTVLLHGDYRPKNVLWSKDQITGVVDWAFWDLGDSYYDLAIILYYLKTEEERKIFFQGYGIKEEDFDLERVHYFDLLSKFINV